MINSVVFTRKEKDNARSRILYLMGSDMSWMKDSEKVEEIQNLAERMFSDKISDKCPLPKLDERTYTLKEYEWQRDLGYQVKEIRSALGMGTCKFQEWRAAMRLTKKQGEQKCTEW